MEIRDSSSLRLTIIFSVGFGMIIKETNRVLWDGEKLVITGPISSAVLPKDVVQVDERFEQLSRQLEQIRAELAELV